MDARATIITLTPNPAVDQMVWLEGLELGRINRLLATQLDPAGKGVNAARVAHRLGWPARTFGFAGGETGAMLERLLEIEGVEHDFVHIPGRTRFNTTIVACRTWTSLRGVGPDIAPEHLDELDRRVCAALGPGRILVMAGSLPPGVPADFYARFVRAAKERGATVLLDAAGEPLSLGVAERPDLIKPNIAEAEHLLGYRLSKVEEVAQGARELVRRGVGTVVVSMGADGAIVARGERVWRVTPPRVERKSTVGSGDSMVAGLAVSIAAGKGLEEGIALATAAGAATAMTPGTARGSAATIEALLPAVRVEELVAHPVHLPAST
ncbi:MAG: 1-phosphofructokinase [Myxococcales bacterium]|jgi:1-phosphofructokinase family hexose kinase